MMNRIKVGSDFSGVGAFDQALIRLGIDYETVFSCDMDKYARQTYIHNYGEPKYYPENVYDREIPKDSLDIYMTSPPCQSFSLAGKRKGKDSENGVLFFNSHEFIQENKPRYFIFENVKGLLSDDNGKTFSEWCNMLGGKSINGLPVLFPYEGSVPYHIYFKVLNSKKLGVPQNRERVFIIGIRDDEDNSFTFPKDIPLERRLKDVLDDDVDDKYFLSEKMLNGFLAHKDRHEEKGTGFKWEPKTEDDTANCIRANAALCPTDNTIVTGNIGGKHPFKEADISVTLMARDYKGVGNQPHNVVKVSKEVRTEESKAKRRETGTNDFRGKELEFRDQDHSNAITTALTNDHYILGYTRDEKGKVVKRNPQDHANTVHSSTGGGGNTDQFVVKSYKPIEKGKEVIFGDKRLTKTVNDNIDKFKNGEPIAIDSYNQSISDKIAPTVKLPHNDRFMFDGVKIRRLTPRECFRLQDFPDSFTWTVSDSQAYKQAGNSITVGVLVAIIKKLKL